MVTQQICQCRANQPSAPRGRPNAGRWRTPLEIPRAHRHPVRRSISMQVKGQKRAEGGSIRLIGALILFTFLHAASPRLPCPSRLPPDLPSIPLPVAQLALYRALEDMNTTPTLRTPRARGRGVWLLPWSHDHPALSPWRQPRSRVGISSSAMEKRSREGSSCRPRPSSTTIAITRLVKLGSTCAATTLVMREGS